jgi:Tfp pilus assembly protein PilN
MRFYIEGSISEVKVEVADAQKQLGSSNNQVLQKEVASLNTQIHNAKNLKDQHYYWSQALAELGNITPDGMHLNTLDADRETGAISVVGVADRREDVIAFWSNVKKSSYFSNIDFPLNNLEKATDTPFSFDFSVNASSIQNKP